mmetsp:Transcript_29126/g.92955  ORF Transcript_29126/g.92955 Transcript_29126/m.92955 type:complete len:139 (+) Transcript_29126:225-641(+)
MGVAASAGAKSLSHSISFGVTLAVLTNLFQYIYWKSLKRGGSHFQRYGPLYLVGCSMPLVMADLTRHILQDSGMLPGSSMYRPSCHFKWHFECLSEVGVLVTLLCTYSGFAFMVAGTVWSADLVNKVTAEWCRLRARA